MLLACAPVPALGPLLVVAEAAAPAASGAAVAPTAGVEAAGVPDAGGDALGGADGGCGSDMVDGRDEENDLRAARILETGMSRAWQSE